MSIETDTFNGQLDLSAGHEDGIMQVKLAEPHYGDWHANYGIWHNFDTLLVLCRSKDKKIVKRGYSIPVERLRCGRGITFVGDLSIEKIPWYEEFRIDEVPYDVVHDDLMSFLKNKSYFSIDDIIEWINRS